MLNVHQEGEFTIVTPEVANLDSHVAADFKNNFTELLSQDSHFMVLDLSNVTFMDSSGLAAIVFCFQLTNIKDKLAICGVGERVMKLFELTQMNSVVSLFDTKKDAITGLTQAS